MGDMAERRWIWRPVVFGVTWVCGALFATLLAGTRWSPALVFGLATLIACWEASLAGHRPGADVSPIDLQRIHEKLPDMLKAAAIYPLAFALAVFAAAASADAAHLYYLALLPLLAYPGVAVELAGRLRATDTPGTFVRWWRAVAVVPVMVVGCFVIHAVHWSALAIGVVAALAFLEALVFEATSPVEAVLRIPRVLLRRGASLASRRGLFSLIQVALVLVAGAMLLALGLLLAGASYSVGLDVLAIDLERTRWSVLCAIVAVALVWPLALTVVVAGLTIVLDRDRRGAES